MSTDTSFQGKIIQGLRDEFKFASPKGKWMQEGECPWCHKKKVFCAADDPKVVKCGSGSCDYEEPVREILKDLFEDWSKRVPTTRENPNATADEYLRSGRGLDVTGLRGHFTQETYREGNAFTATVRFPLPGNSYWERLIDRPYRFRDGKMKARFKPESSVTGNCWMHPEDTWPVLATMDEIWIAEGIFDALALRQNFKRLEKGGRKVKATAVSAMSSNFWPEHFLAGLKQALEGQRRQPEIVFAFDVGKAGVKGMRDFTRRAIAEHWNAGAAILTIDGEGEKRDWNDLLLLQESYRGDEAFGPLSSESLERYRENAAITLARTPQEKADLLADRLKLNSFDFRFGNRTFWAARAGEDDDDGGTRKKIAVEIANCAFRILYQERDEVEDETTYFVQIDYPGKIPTVKARFGSNTVAKSDAFKARLMAFAGTWSGKGDQLDRIIKNQPGLHRKVTPILATGYTAAHEAWVFGDLAVRAGRVIKLNADKYFELGKHSVKLKSDERLLRITYEPDTIEFKWLADLWSAYGEKGIIALAFFTLSLFAQQVRTAPLWHSSVPFLEVTGPPGSGKTTLMVFLHKMLGRYGTNGWEGLDPNKGTASAFGRQLMRIANLPEGLIEGKRDDDKRSGQRQFDYNELLTLYDGRNPRATGKKTSGYEVNEQPFLGTIYLMQNERIDAHEAVLERLVSMAITKERHDEDNRAAAERLKRLPVDAVSGTGVHIVRQEKAWLEAFAARYAHHDEDMRRRTSCQGLHNDRIIKNHAQLAATIETLPKLFPTAFRPEWARAAIAELDRLALDRQLSVVRDHPLITDFWEKFDFLTAREAATDHEEGKSLNRSRHPDRTIAVNLPLFEARCHTAGLRLPDMDRLKKLLRQSTSRKWLATKNTNVRHPDYPAGRSEACWIFERPDHERPII